MTQEGRNNAPTIWPTEASIRFWNVLLENGVILLNRERAGSASLWYITFGLIWSDGKTTTTAVSEPRTPGTQKYCGRVLSVTKGVFTCSILASIMAILVSIEIILKSIEPIVEKCVHLLV